MYTKKLKRNYSNLQMKLFNYVTLLDDMLTQYLTNPTSISYKKISKLNKIISAILVHNYDLQNKIIYSELIA